MSNTTQRILSAIVMMVIIIAAGFIGPNGLMILLFVSGLLLVDELVFNMLKIKRAHISYMFAMASFFGGFLLINYFDQNGFYYDYIIQTGVTINTALLAYLFFERMEAGYFVGFMKKNSFFMGLFFLIPISSIAYLLTQEMWLHYIVLMLLVNFLVDTGAWFFGKNFGNKKLWPAISPKKTVTGTLGGIFTSVFISSIYIHLVFNKLNLLIIVSLLILTMFAQLGDLIESKLKRQLSVKDSSNLIPGHGGIYDRLDSLIFVAPFYVMMVKYLF
jgi:phosphatidate cytidylyltransferase